jgi:hypothetical protein
MNRFEGIRNASLAPLGSKAISFMTCKKLFIPFFYDLLLPSQDGHLATWQNQNICVQ